MEGARASSDNYTEATVNRRQAWLFTPKFEAVTVKLQLICPADLPLRDYIILQYPPPPTEQAQWRHARTLKKTQAERKERKSIIPDIRPHLINTLDDILDDFRESGDVVRYMALNFDYLHKQLSRHILGPKGCSAWCRNHWCALKTPTWSHELNYLGQFMGTERVIWNKFTYKSSYAALGEESQWLVWDSPGIVLAIHHKNITILTKTVKKMMFFQRH